MPDMIVRELILRFVEKLVKCPAGPACGEAVVGHRLDEDVGDGVPGFC